MKANKTIFLFFFLIISICSCSVLPEISEDAKDIAEDYSGLSIDLDKDCFDSKKNMEISVKISD